MTNIKTLSGHLTPTNKQHIRAIFDQIPDAKQEKTTTKVNRITYTIERIKDNEYQVKTKQKTSDWGRSTEQIYISTFEVK